MLTVMRYTYLLLYDLAICTITGQNPLKKIVCSQPQRWKHCCCQHINSSVTSPFSPVLKSVSFSPMGTAPVSLLTGRNLLDQMSFPHRTTLPLQTNVIFIQNISNIVRLRLLLGTDTLIISCNENVLPAVSLFIMSFCYVLWINVFMYTMTH